MATLTLTLAASADDAALSDLGYDDSGTTMNVGATGTSSGNYGQGWRFTNVTLTSADTVTSVKLQLVKNGDQWVTYINRFTCINEDNTAAFSSGSPPGSRAIVATIVVDNTNVNELGGTTIDLPHASGDQDSLAAAVQAVINRAGWASGNAIAIVNNSAQDASAETGFARKSFYTYNNGAGFEPKLVITYTPGAAATVRMLATLGVGK